MAINRSVDRSPVSVAEAHLARVAADGSSRHRHLTALLEASGSESGPRPRRRGASAVRPARQPPEPGRARPSQIARQAMPATGWPAPPRAFERERLFLVRLTSAVGPLPSTPGAAETEATTECAAQCARNPRDVGAPRLCARRRRRSGRRLVADPPPARPRRVARRARLRRLRPCPTKHRSSRSSKPRRTRRPASARSASAASSCCSSTAACSTCSKPAPRPARDY